MGLNFYVKQCSSKHVMLYQNTANHNNEQTTLYPERKTEATPHNIQILSEAWNSKNWEYPMLKRLELLLILEEFER